MTNAVLLALGAHEKMIADLRNAQALLAQGLSGDFNRFAARVTALEGRVDDLAGRLSVLEYVVSEEIVAGVSVAGRPVRWLATVAGGDGGEGFVHSPGYPADDGECSGADELTDTGLTYRELDSFMHPGDWG